MKIKHIIWICMLISAMLLAAPLYADYSGSLIGYWKYDETAGDTAYDSTDNDHDGDIVDVTKGATGKYDNAFSFDGTTGTLYRNGEPVASNAWSLGTDTEAAVVFGCSQNGGGNPFNGALDDIRIYNRVLTEGEILCLVGLRGDLHEDQKIDFKDYAILADYWLDEQLWPAP